MDRLSKCRRSSTRKRSGCTESDEWVTAVARRPRARPGDSAKWVRQDEIERGARDGRTPAQSNAPNCSALIHEYHRAAALTEPAF
jgi:hypothetical protein